MGKVLQIRVTARTHDPEDVRRHWPELTRLAWGRYNSTEKVVGLRELIARLNDLWKFGNDWTSAARERIGHGLPALVDLDRQLDSALADWRPEQADRLSYLLEDGLDRLEGDME